MANDDKYTSKGFCPRCGALMRDGVCMSCGYGEQRNEYAGSENQENDYGCYDYNNYDPSNGSYAPEPKKSRKGLVICVCVGLFVLLIAALAAVGVSVYRAVSDNINVYSEDGWDYYDYYYYYDEGYVPSEDDSYYEEITDSTRTDLSYSIVWVYENWMPEADDDYCTFYTTYPVLSGDGDYAEINAAITEMAETYKYVYTDYKYGCASYGYVTYMDEEMISVVFQHSLYAEIGTIPIITALTFDVETGELLKLEDQIDLDYELAMRFHAQDSTQNGGVEYVQSLTDDEILDMLGDDESAIFFYSPVGLEIGFNYEDDYYGYGWVTVTMKELIL